MKKELELEIEKDTEGFEISIWKGTRDNHILFQFFLNEERFVKFYEVFKRTFNLLK